MMNNKKINIKIVLLVFSIIAFLVVLVSASFAYYATSASNPTGATSIANANVIVPKGCTFTGSSSSSKCSISPGNGPISSTDNIITTAEMMETYKNTVVATSNCSVSAYLTGNVGCQCEYGIYLEETSSSSRFRPLSSSSPNKEFTARIKKRGQDYIDETNINNLVGLIDIDSLSITPTSIMISSTVGMSYDITIKYYNIPSDQTTHGGKAYSYKLTSKPISCNGVSYVEDSATLARFYDVCQNVSGNGLTPGAVYDCALGYEQRAYVVLESGDGKISLLSYQNYTDFMIPSRTKWCKDSSYNDCNHDILDKYILRTQSILGNNVKVSLPTYEQMWAAGCRLNTASSCPLLIYQSSISDYGFYLADKSGINNAYNVEMDGSIRNNYSISAERSFRYVITLAL